MGKHEKKSKKKSKKHKKERRRSTSSSSSNDSEEWIEKETSPKTSKNNEQDAQTEQSRQKERDEWMSLPTLFATASSSDRRKEREEAKQKEKQLSTYDPSKSTRELNPYWKSGGDGLPSLNQQKAKFMKPGDEEKRSYNSSYRSQNSRPSWRKRSPDSNSDRRYKSEDSRGSWRKRSPDSSNRCSPERRNTDRHSPERRRNPDRHSPERNLNRHSPDRRRNPDKNSPERRRYPDKHSPDRRRYPDRYSPERRGNQDRYSPERRRNQDKHSPERRNQDRHSPERKRNQDRHSPERKDKIKYDASTLDIIYTNEDSPPSTSIKEETSLKSSDILTDKEMNDIAAKIVKAEILGNTAKITELKAKLERAREARQLGQPTDANKEENVLLFRTDSKGFSKPLEAPETSDYKRKKKAETHDSGKRQKYYADDDKYNLKQMFEKERFSTNAQQDAEFIKLTAKASKMDDLDDIFMDKIRNEKSNEKTFQKERDAAIREHQKMTESLDSCQHCLQSTSMQKHLMVSLGETVYLSLPPCEPLTEGHCLIIPTRHVSCATQLDENEWSEISDIRKSLTNMFLSQDKDVIFYETVLNAHSYAHMVLDCVPVPKDQGDLAPIYFKKAIDECETEWSTNKKLINLRGKDVRRAVPKGLPYFFVSFGMNEGFAHVIEDQRYFPKYFAAEIIGGILDLHHSKWRKQFNEKFDKQKLRVLEFSDMWKNYDCTIKT